MTQPFYVLDNEDRACLVLGFVGDYAVVCYANRILKRVPLTDLTVDRPASDWPLGVRLEPVAGR